MSGIVEGIVRSKRLVSETPTSRNRGIAFGVEKTMAFFRFLVLFVSKAWTVSIVFFVATVFVCRCKETSLKSFISTHMRLPRVYFVYCCTRF